MSNIVENLFSAVDIQIDSKLRQTDYTRTIIGTVIGCIDPEQRIYKINYQDTIFEAQAPTGEYGKDEKVKILTTNVEDESLKVIVGRTSVSDLTTLKESSLYTSLGSSIVEDNEEDDIVEYTLSDSKTILYEKGESNNLLKVNETLLEKHLKESMMFSIGAEVLAELSSGSIDLVFELSYKGQLVKSAVKIEITQNSFDFKSYQSYFKDYEFDTIESIYLEKINELSNSEVLKIKNITFNIIKENESANRMQAVIHGYEGDTLHDKVEQITIEARMMQGATFIDPDLCGFQWYIEDPWEESGWKKLETARWQRPIVQLTSEDIYYSPMKYKVEITYGEMIFEANTILKNLTPSYSGLYISQQTVDSYEKVLIAMNENEKECQYKWEHIDVYGQKDTSYSTEQQISVFLDSNYNLWKCHYRDGDKYIGYASIVINNDDLLYLPEQTVEFAFSDNEDHAPFDGPWAPRIGEISNIDKPILWKRVTKNIEEGKNTIVISSCKERNIAYIETKQQDLYRIWRVYYTNGFIEYNDMLISEQDDGYQYILYGEKDGLIDIDKKKEATLESDINTDYPYLCYEKTNTETRMVLAKLGTADYTGIPSLTFYWIGNNYPYVGVENSKVYFGKPDKEYDVWTTEALEIDNEYKNRYRTECPYNQLGKLHYNENTKDWSNFVLDGNYSVDGLPGAPGAPGEPGKAAKSFRLKTDALIYKKSSPEYIAFSIEISGYETSEWEIKAEVLKDSIWTSVNDLGFGIVLNPDSKILTLEHISSLYSEIRCTAELTSKEAVDVVTLTRIEDGEAGFNVIISNPNIIFDKINNTAIEVADIEVYQGKEKIECYDTKPITNDSSKRYVAVVSNKYQKESLNKPDNALIQNLVFQKSAPEEEKLTAMISNPGESGKYYLQIEIYDNTIVANEGSVPEIILDSSINCLVIDNGLRINIYSENYSFQNAEKKSVPLEIAVQQGLATVVDRTGTILTNVGYEFQFFQEGYITKDGEEVKDETFIQNILTKQEGAYYQIENPWGLGLELEYTIYKIKLNFMIYLDGKQIGENIQWIYIYYNTKGENSIPYLELSSSNETIMIDESFNPINSFVNYFNYYINEEKQIIDIERLSISPKSNDTWAYEYKKLGNDQVIFTLLDFPKYNGAEQLFNIIYTPETGNPVRGMFTLRVAQKDFQYQILFNEHPNGIIDTTNSKATDIFLETISISFKDDENIQQVYTTPDSLPSGYQLSYLKNNEEEVIFTGNEEFSVELGLTDTVIFNFKKLDTSYGNLIILSKTLRSIFNGSELTTYKAFNTLTNNGENTGIIYLAKNLVTDGGDYDIEDMNGSKYRYVQVYPRPIFEDFDGSNKFSTIPNDIGGIGILYNADSVELFINASMIKTGILNADLISAGAIKIGDKFYANADKTAIDPEVKIGGFKVAETYLYSGERTSVWDTQAEGAYFGTNGISVGSGSSGMTASFAVDTTDKGIVGGWYFTGQGFQTKDVYNQTYANQSSSIDAFGLGPAPSDQSKGYYILNDGTAFLKYLLLEEYAVTSSDEKYKNSISANLEKYSILFDQLQPVSYKYNKDESQQTHFGFTVQKTQQAFSKANLNSQDFAIVQCSNDINGLVYTEFIALNTYEIQKLKKQVSELETQNSKLEERIAALEKIIINSN